MGTAESTTMQWPPSLVKGGGSFCSAATKSPPRRLGGLFVCLVLANLGLSDVGHLCALNRDFQLRLTGYGPGKTKGFIGRARAIACDTEFRIQGDLRFECRVEARLLGNTRESENPYFFLCPNASCETPVAAYPPRLSA
jgi:hypothetical protein